MDSIQWWVSLTLVLYNLVLMAFRGPHNLRSWMDDGGLGGLHMAGHDTFKQFAASGVGPTGGGPRCKQGGAVSFPKF